MYKFTENETLNQEINNAFFAPARKLIAKVEEVEYTSSENSENSDPERTVVHTYLHTDDVQSIEAERTAQKENALIGGAFSKKYTIKLLDKNASYSFEGKRLKPYIGIEYNSKEYYAPFPEADVYEATYDSVKKLWTLVCCDDMQKLDGLLIKDLRFDSQSATLLEYAGALCAQARLELENTSIFNGNLSFPLNDFSGEQTVSGAPNLSGNETFREVLESVAEAALSNAVITRDGKVKLVPVGVLLNQSADLSLNAEKYFSMTVGEQFGPLNRITLSRTGEDNIYSASVITDENQTESAVYIGELTLDEHIAQNGINELKITDNAFLDRTFGESTERQNMANAILAEIKGLTYFAYTLSYRSNPAADEGDVLLLTSPEAQSIKTLYLADTVSYNGGLSATSEGKSIKQGETDYSKASTIENKLKLTQLKVDKNEGSIKALATSVNESKNAVESLKNSITATSKELDITISKTGGSNLIRNSAFYKGITAWETSDDLQYFIEDEEALTRGTETGMKLILQNGSIKQSFRAILNETYTFSCLFKNKKTINGRVSGIKIIFSDDIAELVPQSNDSSSDWKKLKYTFTAKGTYTPTLMLYTDNGNNDMEVADIRITQGNVEQPWSQHSEEIYGKTHRLDDSGLEILSVAGESTRMKIDNNSVCIMNGSNNICEFSTQKLEAPEGRFSEGMKINNVNFTAVNANRIFISKGEN